jgi:hypothetical protein
MKKRCHEGDEGGMKEELQMVATCTLVGLDHSINLFSV